MSEHWSRAAGKLLDPGESLRAALVVTVAPGNLPRTPLPEPRVWTRYKILMAYSLVLGLTKPWHYLPDSASDRLYGVAAAGAPGSRAAELIKAYRGIPSAPARVTVVTDRRFLLCAGDQRDQLDARWEVPRTDIVRTCRERYRLQARFRVEFADGSWVRYGTPMFRSDRSVHELGEAFTA